MLRIISWEDVIISGDYILLYTTNIRNCFYI